MKKLKTERGLLSLEACIAVTIFLFLMLFLYSYFVVFEVRNEMAHVVLAVTNSMALDPYGNEKLGDSGNISQLITKVYHTATSTDNGFVSFELWNKIGKGDVETNTWDGSIQVPSSEEKEPDDYGNYTADSSLLTKVIKERMVAYLADGNESEADRILKKYHIVGGLDGLDFSGSKVSSGKLYIKATYTLEYEFNVFDLGTIELQQSACSKIWK